MLCGASIVHRKLFAVLEARFDRVVLPETSPSPDRSVALTAQTQGSVALGQPRSKNTNSYLSTASNPCEPAVYALSIKA